MCSVVFNEWLIIEDGFGFSSESSGSNGSDSNDALKKELRILEYGSDSSNHDSSIFDSTTKTKTDSLSSSANNDSLISTTVHYHYVYAIPGTFVDMNVCIIDILRYRFEKCCSARDTVAISRCRLDEVVV